MNRITFVALFSIMITALLLSSCEKVRERLPEGMGGAQQKEAAGEAAKEQEEQEEQTVFAVNTTKAVQGGIIDYLEFTGEVITRASVDVFPDAAGKVTELDIEVGSYVKKDQVIAKVDPSKPGMKYVANPVKSPIAGTVIEIPAHVGATVSPSMPIAKVSRTYQKQVHTFVPEKYISKMKYGLTALLSFAAYPEETFTARISEMSPVVDPQSRTLEIKMNLVPNDPRIKPGMFAEIKIITEQKDNIVKIPVECLVQRFGVNTAFVVTEDNTVEKREVTTGIQIDNKAEIVDGLEPGETVVIRGQTLLEDGSPVKVIEQVEPLESQDTVE